MATTGGYAMVTATGREYAKLLTEQDKYARQLTDHGPWSDVDMYTTQITTRIRYGI